MTPTVRHLQLQMMTNTKPLVLVHVLAKDKELTLPYYLETLEQWSYPKDRIILYVKTNNNQDRTQEILEQWLSVNSTYYHKVIYESYDLNVPITQYKAHEWDNPHRHAVMRNIRGKGFIVAFEEGCDFYFTSDVDNYLVPETLETLVDLDLPVVSPMLRYAASPEEEFGPLPSNWTYSNFTTKVMDCGDSQNSTGEFPLEYYQLLLQEFRGLYQVELVHCTYLVRREVFSRITYQNGNPGGWEYIVFPYNLRINGIPQILDNRKIYGCLTHREENVEYCQRYLEELKKL